MKIILPALLIILGTSSAYSADRIDLEGTSIRGNRELPKVLYIAPWKRASMKDLGRPLDSLVNEVMAPLERREFQRQIEFHYQVSSQNKKK
jgi:hypothetical protein